ncbi:MAG TPA: hydrogenase maturation protease [Terriglobales bacterium]|nr:hydrogenase maturation protease [Terriglobales bacterium]
MARILILAYGNPLRGDDGLGWRAAEVLLNDFAEGMEIRTCHQLLPEVAEPVSRADAIFFIDAARDGEPGELRCRALTPENSAARFTHQLSPAGILALSAELYGHAPKAFLMSICGDSFGFSEKLSPAVAASLPRLTGLVKELVRHVRY